MEGYEFDAVIDAIADVEGGGTWFITLYIRPDKSLTSVRNRIIQEVSEAESIKSDETRDRVQSSLQKIVDALGEYRETPENGMAVFSSPNEIRVLDDLPFPCPENWYHCGSEFVTEPLEAEFDTGNKYGLIVVERGRASIGVLSRGRIVDVTEKESQVMGKTRAGGQSQARFERLREEQKHEFFKSVQSLAELTFDNYAINGVVIGGTLSTAKEFSENYVRHDWSILGTYSVDHGDEQGLSELVERAENRILDEDDAEVRELVGRFLSGLRDDSVAYGEDAVVEKLEHGAVDVLLLSSTLSLANINHYSNKSDNFGTDVVVVSPTFEEAEMFENISGGYGAILRW